MDPQAYSGYGIKDGNLVHISDVPRGLACACVCVDCGKPLLARKGNKRREHFAHAPTAAAAKKGQLSPEEERVRQLELSKRLERYWKRW